MYEKYLLTHPWLPTLLWVILYNGDYYLTIQGAKLSKKQTFIKYTGSYELTPEFQEDVDNLNRVSAQHIAWLVGVSGLLYWMGAWEDGSRYIYGMLIGFLLIPQLWVHGRHIENIIQFRRLSGPEPDAYGQLISGRKSIYQISAQNGVFASIFVLAFFFLTGSPILLGGVISFLYISYSHYKLSKTLEVITGPCTEENNSSKAEEVL